MQKLHRSTSKRQRDRIHLWKHRCKKTPPGNQWLFHDIYKNFEYFSLLIQHENANRCKRCTGLLQSVKGTASTFENNAAKRHPQGTNDFSMIFIRISNLHLYLFNLKRQTNVKVAQVYFKASKEPHPPLKTMKRTNDFSMICIRISYFKALRHRIHLWKHWCKKTSPGNQWLFHDIYKKFEPFSLLI